VPELQCSAAIDTRFELERLAADLSTETCIYRCSRKACRHAGFSRTLCFFCRAIVSLRLELKGESPGAGGT